MRILLKNGRVIDPANVLDEKIDLMIANGKIVALGTPPCNFTPDKTIDATGLWIVPGLIDLCCRPQMAHPSGSTLLLEAKAALKRGMTALCIPPDGSPIIDNPQNVSRLIPLQDDSLPDLYSIGALTTGLAGEMIADLCALAQAGCIAFSHAQKPLQDLNLLRHCYDYAASFNLTVIIQPQDYALAKNGIAHEGFIATRLGLPGIPQSAETIAIATHLLLIEHSGVKAHFTCLSSGAAVDLIAQAKAKQLPVSCDVAMHHLHLTENDIADFDANCHVYPPLRSIADRNALVRGVANGTIDAICSDHRPLDSSAKLAPFGDATPGMSTIDTYLSLGLHLMKNQQLSASELIRSLTVNPATIFNLPKGTLSPESAADVCIINPEHYWVVSEQSLLSQGKNSAFKGWEIPGLITHIIHRGQVVHEA